MNRKVDKMYYFPIQYISMKYRDYIERHHAFTVEQLKVHCDIAISSMKTTLKRSLEAGQIKRVRRGVYVSNIGRFADSRVDAAELVMAIDNEAVLSYHSALEIYGVAHNVSSVCQFRSHLIKSMFLYSGITYKPFSYSSVVLEQSVQERENLAVLVTTKEQTVIDCLEYPDRAGGIEEVIMSLTLFPYLDVTKLIELVSTRSASLAARVGWLLEQKAHDWRVSPNALNELEQFAQGGPFRLDKNSLRSRGWSKRWKLCLPVDEEEIAQWVL